MLSRAQRSFLAARDCAVVAGTGKVTTLRDSDEGDVTIRRDGERTFICKRCRSRPSGTPYLYDAVGGGTIAVPEVAWDLLEETSWAPSDLRRRLPEVPAEEVESAVRLLEGFLTPVSGPGFRFP